MLVLWLQRLLESLRETYGYHLCQLAKLLGQISLAKSEFCWSSPEPIGNSIVGSFAPNRAPPLRIHFLRLQLSVDAVRHSSQVKQRKPHRRSTAIPVKKYLECTSGNCLVFGQEDKPGEVDRGGTAANRWHACASISAQSSATGHRKSE